MSDRIFYYLWTRDIKFDGNDCAWVSGDSAVYDIRKAQIFSQPEMIQAIKNGHHSANLKPYEVHKINKLIQFHVSLSKIKNKKPVDGDKCYLICTRDTCGKNAAFWHWNHSGYGSDIRNAQIFNFKQGTRVTDRKIDVLVPISAVWRHFINCFS